MFASIMYHHAGEGEFGNPQDLLDRQCRYLRRRNIRTVWPGEPVRDGCCLCLVFDDATYDFYHFVWPLLMRHGLRAILAVPTAHIPHTTEASDGERLGLALSALTRATRPQTHAGFCTWPELERMRASGSVLLVPHGHIHAKVASVESFMGEASEACELLRRRTGHCPDAYVLPYGIAPPGGVERLRYELGVRHVFGIGAGKYGDWGDGQPTIARFPGDHQPDATALIDAIFPRRSLRYRLGVLRRHVTAGVLSRLGASKCFLANV